MLLQLFYAAIILGGCTLSRASDPRRILKAPEIPNVAMGDQGLVNVFFRESADVAPYSTHNAEFYKEDGPIIFMNASEVDASGIVPHYSALNAALLQDSGDCIGSEKAVWPVRWSLN
ncbi:hypothetical protein EDD85DRAFT_960734 [Armillaria nabsnona]|nr:hypothetical protein EDD85DRAFT_960734 [Armillaria nabsnona]